MKRASLALIAAVTLLISIPATALAAEPRDVFRAGANVRVGAEERVPHSLFATGESVVIDGVIEGDLIAAARHIEVNGTVEGDLWAVGQTIIVSGAVLGDVRSAGRELRLSGPVGASMQIGGQTVVIAPDARVAWRCVHRGVSV